MELKITPWDETLPVTAELMEQDLVDQQLRVYHWSMLPNEVAPGHTHSYHKVLYVVDGSIRFDFPTRHKSANLKAGDKLELPAGVRHHATVGPDGVSCFEAHVY